MPTYTLRRFMRPRDGWYGPEDAVQEIEARDHAEAIQITQAHAAEPDDALLAIDLTNADEYLIWRLMRGETVSHRPDDVS